MTADADRFAPALEMWNKIEHHMFCHITNNWRGRPLLTRQAVVNLIHSVTTAQGLHVKAELDEPHPAPAGAL